MRTKGLDFLPEDLAGLMDKGLTRANAYDLVQALAMKSWKERLDFKAMVLADKDILKH